MINSTISYSLNQMAKMSPNISSYSLNLTNSHSHFHKPTKSLANLQSRFRLAGNRRTEIIAAAEESTASEVVKKFYGGINGRDLSSVEPLISLNCVYEDLVFPRPFVGRQEILEFFESFVNVVDENLQFVIDKISTEDSSSIGVTWHLEWKGKPFPFSKGCSFYQLEIIDGKRQIIYARDSVEPAIKPGKSALDIIRGVTWLLQQFPQLANRF